MDTLLLSVLIGVGATALIDLWAIARKRLLGIPALDYALVGRWFGHMARGRFRHERIAAAPSMPWERLIGWSAHYLTGIVFAALLLALWGPEWARQPSIGPALLVGVGSVLAPFLLMQPGMGAGIAASRTPRPAAARVQTLVTHTIFGVGLYATALTISMAANWTGFGFQAQGREMPRIRAALQLGPGMTIADVGAGKGGLSAALSTEVGGNGRIFSTDVDRGRVEALRERFAHEKRANVTVLEGGVSDARLPPACCDAIVLRRVYHHLTDTPAINASLLRSLKPGGVLAVIDFPPPFFLGRSEFGVPPKDVVAEVTRSGFELVRLMNDWPGRGPLGSYCALFRKPL